MSYSPDSIAVAQQQTQRFVRTLSQRELSLVVPVNFVTYPGVVLSAACFAHGQYVEDAAVNCFSNLLAVGFRRIEADIYWDASRRNWSLCPVELAGNGSGQEVLTTSTSIPITPLQTATRLSTNFITDRETPAAIRGRDEFDPALKRQTNTNATPSSPSSAAPSAPSTTSSYIGAQATPTAANPAQSQDTSIEDNELLHIGPYTCNAGTDLSLLANVLSAYFTNTGNRLNATTVMLTLNLHAAAPASNPSSTPPQLSGDRLPSEQSLSNIITPNLSAYLYTPDQLLKQRSDLNSESSWFAINQEARPDTAFFQVYNTSDRSSTPDGWPSESYVELDKSQRLLIGFGDIDSQISDYDFTGDEGFIFPSNYLETRREVTTTSTGNITSGCFFNPDNTSITSDNSSWAIAAIGDGMSTTGNALQSILAQANNLTFCGISPILNSTLDNITADQSLDQYLAFVQSTVWSWGLDEPINASSSADLDDYRCAAMNATSGYWQASDCSETHRGACRRGNNPYTWSISNAAAPYDRIDLACDDSTTFDTPRNSLENTYLLSEWRSWHANHKDDDDDSPLLWLNFNDLDVSTCWVIGQDTSCPYEDDVRDTESREIIVPVVGGIVVFALAGLTILVKCAGNRQQVRRRRRRGDDGWDYEGVPS